MKKFLLFLGSTLGLLATAGSAFAAIPTVTYTPPPNYIVGTPITALSPTVGGGGVTGTYGALANFSTALNGLAAVVTFDPVSNQFYAVDYADGWLYKISTAGVPTVINKPVISGNAGTSIIVDGLGNIYLADASAGKVYEFNSSGTLLNTVTGFTTLGGLAVDANNNIYVADAKNGVNGNGIIYEIAAGTTTNTKTSFLTGFSNPFGLAVSGSDLYVSQYGTNAANRSILKEAGAIGGTAVQSTFVAGTSISTPRNITFDAGGNLIVANTGGGNILKVTPAGAVTTILTSTTYQVTFDSAGNMYVADETTRIKKSTVQYFTYTGTLPPGLNFNPVTGVITGTPATAGSYSISVTGHNSSGNSAPAAVVNFTCNPAPPSLSYTATPYTFINGVSNTTVTITDATGAGVVTTTYTFSITSGLLPAGITFNSSDGSFSVVPTATGSFSGTVTASNSGGPSVAPITITVNNPAVPIISYASPQIYTTGIGITALNPSNTGGAALSYAVSAATPLPSGLLLNTTNGQITGTPGVATPSSGYTITASNGGGTSAPFNLMITVVDPPSFTYGGPYTYAYGVSIPAFAPTGTGTPITGATISPALPLGVTMAADGTITGTAGATSPSTQYTVTATGSDGGTGTATFFLEIDPAPLTLTATGPAKTYGTALTAGTSATNFTATGAIPGQAVTSVTLTPDAAGMSATTPALSGYVITPSAPTGTGGFLASNYTITVVPYSGTVSAKNLTITATGPAKTYGTALTTGTGTTFTASGAITGETVTSVTLTPDANGMSASTTALTAYSVIPSAPTGTGGFLASNYNITYNPYNGTVAKYPLTITATAQTKVYGTTFTFAGTEFTTSGTLFSDNVSTVTLTCAGSVNTATVAGGPYTITPSAAVGIGLSNYAITYATTGKMTVTGAPLTVTATGPAKTYGTALANGTSTTNFTTSATVLGQTVTSVTFTITGTGKPANGPALSTYVVAPSAPTGAGFNAGNYTITYVNYNGIVAQAPLTITASTNNKTYGATLTNGNITTGFTSTGRQNGETIGFVNAMYGAGSAPTDPVGTYTNQITISAAGGGSFNPANYAITYNTGNIVVGTATLTITANSVTKTIGTTLTGGPGSTAFTISGQQNSETIGTVTIAYGAAGAAGAAIGTYNNQVTPSAATGGSFTASNYTINYVKGNITVIDFPPGFTYNTPNVYPVNVAIATLGPVNTAGAGTVIAPGIDGGTNLTVTPNFNGPQGMAVDASGNLYVVNNNGTIKVFNSSGTYTGTFGSGLTNPVGMVFDGMGNAFVLDATKNKVYEFNPGGSLTNTLSVTGLNAASAIAIDNSGNLYIANTGANDVLEVNSATGAIINTITSHITAPTGIAIDNSGNIYVANAFSFSTFTSIITKYSAAGTYLSTVKTDALGNFSAISIDASGNIYVADDSPLYDQVSEYSSTGATLNNIGGWNTPEGIIANSKGDFFVSDNANNTVTEYAPTGGFYISGPLPAGLSFSSTTGRITGTPTAVFPTTTYTVTAYNSGGAGTSNPFTISCYLSFDWVGTQPGGDWNTTANWASLTVPGSGDAAKIGVNTAFTYAPVVSTTGATTVNVGSVLFGNAGGQAAGITVNTGRTLVVTNDITNQSDANSTLGYVAYLAGAGNIKAVNLNVTANTAGAAPYTATVNSSVANLQLSGNIALASTMGTSAENAQFRVTGGVTSLTSTGATGIISTTNQSGSIATIAVSAGTLQWANATGLSGLSGLPGSNILLFTGTGVIGYAGANQTVYTDLPVTGLASGVSYQGISFSGTGIKMPNGASTNNLNIAGSFTNSLANDVADSVSLINTIVNFNGTGAQALAGGIASQTYGTIFKTVNFSNAGIKTMSGNFYVAPSGTLTLSSSAQLVAGDNATTPTVTDASLTLLANSISAAAIAPVTSGSITGNVNVQRYISGERGYRLISSPVYAGTDANSNKIYSLNYLKNNLYLTGSGSGFQSTGNPTLYLYDERFAPQYTSFLNSNFVGIASISSGTGATPGYTLNVNGDPALSTSANYNIPAGNAFLCFFRGNLLTETVANLTNPGFPAVAATVTATGNLTQGQVTVADWFTPSSQYLSGTLEHFNIIGNPYASAIDLSTVATATTSSGIYMTPYDSDTNTGIAKFISELNPVTGIYGTYDYTGSTIPINGATQYIASGQGFAVQVFGANTSQVIFNENGKATSTNANAPGLMARRVNLGGPNPVTKNPALRLKMSLDTLNNEESLILFNPSSKASYVFNEDAPHRTGQGKVGFSTLSSDNIPMAVNSAPLLKTQTIPLKVSATNDGNYTLKMDQLEPLPALYDIWLKDAFLKDSLDIKNNPDYSFSIANADTSTYGAYRLSLVIRQNPALMVHLLNFAATKQTTGDQVLWTTENEANYTSFTVQRSTDGGKTFTGLDGFVSSALGNYTYLDRAPVMGANSYRLEMTDLNGAVTYSNIVTIMYANTNNQIAKNGMIVYPNPTVGVVNLSITGNQAVTTGATTNLNPSYSIEIVNNLGAVVQTATSTSVNWQTDVSAFKPGTYFIQVTDLNQHKVVGKTAFVRL